MADSHTSAGLSSTSFFFPDGEIQLGYQSCNLFLFLVVTIQDEWTLDIIGRLLNWAFSPHNKNYSLQVKSKISLEMVRDISEFLT